MIFIPSFKMCLNFGVIFLFLYLSAKQSHLVAIGFLVLFQCYCMCSRRLSSPYFMLTLSILIFIPTSLCAYNEQHINCKKTFQCANIQTLHQPSRFTMTTPFMVPSRQLAELPQQSGLDFLLYSFSLCFVLMAAE
jgi:hypothetical protein